MAEVVSASADELLAEARDATDAQLERWAARLETEVPGLDGAALGYALRSPGKRVRAALVLAGYRSVGGRSPAIAGVAAAVETVHTYSLVHDDLPCMDDDDLRRGRPTTHRRFGVPVATQAGYLLVPVAAQVLADAAAGLGLDEHGLGRMATTLFEAGGIEGMVGGQWLDLEAEGRSLTLAQLMTVHRGKTGALIRASLQIGGLLGGGRAHEVDALCEYGAGVGLAFQIVDDVLDLEGSEAGLGKSVGKDARDRKATFPALLGVPASKRRAAKAARAAVAALRPFGSRAARLADLAGFIVERAH